MQRGLQYLTVCFKCSVMVSQTSNGNPTLLRQGNVHNSHFVCIGRSAKNSLASISCKHQFRKVTQITCFFLLKVNISRNRKSLVQISTEERQHLIFPLGENTVTSDLHCFYLSMIYVFVLFRSQRASRLVAVFASKTPQFFYFLQIKKYSNPCILHLSFWLSQVGKFLLFRSL